MEQNEFIEMLRRAVVGDSKELGGARYKVGAPAGPYMHGPGGIFGVAGLERPVISTRVQPRGLAAVLPWKPNAEMFPFFPYITGFKADTGSDPVGVCDDGKVAGVIKGGLQTAQFGRYTRMTNPLERNRLGQRVNRGEFFDLAMVNNPLGPDNLSGVTPSSAMADGAFNPNLEIMGRFAQVGISFQNLLIQQLWQGNPANNSGPLNNPTSGGYLEFPGLDILIGTAKYDALAGVALPSLNSYVVDFGYNLITNLASGVDIVAQMTYAFRQVRHNANRMAFSNPQWIICMREEAFYEISGLWPCSYMTQRCQFRTNNGTIIQNVDAASQVRMTDDMREGQYLTIDGRNVPVVFDDGITENVNGDGASAQIGPGQYASDISIIPLSASGMQLTYWEYFPYDTTPNNAMQEVGPSRDFWTDGGKFLWTHKPPTMWCEQWAAKIEPRVILHAPQLAARINNVMYQPLSHTREPFPGDSYFVNGGVTERDAPSLYSDWSIPA